MTDADKTPNPVDLYVGGRIRLRRRTLGVSQERLAGANRVSASKLYEIARSLSVPVAFFFEGLTDPVSGGVAEQGAHAILHDFLMTSEGVELASLFPMIRRPRIRRRILELVRAMAEEEADAAATAFA